MSFLITADQQSQETMTFPVKSDHQPAVIKEQDIQIISCAALKTWLTKSGSDGSAFRGCCPMNPDAVCCISQMLEGCNNKYTLLITKHDISLTRIQSVIGNRDVGAVVDLLQLNCTRHINKYLEKINAVLPYKAQYFGCVETNCQRNKRLYSHCNRMIAVICIFCEFFIHRILPKIKFIQKLYFKITKGKYRFLTTAEALGRMVCCGFEIQNFREIDNLTYCHVSKAREPVYDLHPSYGPLIRLRRVGQNGKIFNVYKFRTMHPYSEYLQDYFVQHYGYNHCGKPANDFRIAFWGRFMRRYWLDEIPQLINLIKGDMKIMGVRPISIVRFSEFPKDLQELRTKNKTGCIPPYVALNMPSATDNIEAERIYLSEHEEHPILTDLKYISMAVYNILANKIRSS